MIRRPITRAITPRRRTVGISRSATGRNRIGTCEGPPRKGIWRVGVGAFLTQRRGGRRGAESNVFVLRDSADLCVLCVKKKKLELVGSHPGSAGAVRPTNRTGPHTELDVRIQTTHHKCGDDPRLTSPDSAPAGVLCEAKGGTLPDSYRRSFASPRRAAGE